MEFLDNYVSNIFLTLFPSYFDHSAFVIKLKRREVVSVENGNASLKSSDGESMISSSNNMDCDMDPEEFVQDENKKGTFSFLCCHRK